MMGNFSLALSSDKVLLHSLFLLMIRKTKGEKIFHRDWGTEMMEMSPSIREHGDRDRERDCWKWEGLKEPVRLTKSARKSDTVDGILGDG